MKEDTMGRTCRMHGEENGKTERKRPLERPRRRWVDNIKMDAVVWTGFILLRIGTNGGLL
jgi:hypothetical protein